MVKTTEDAGTTMQGVQETVTVDGGIGGAANDSTVFDDTNLADAATYNGPHGAAVSGQRSAGGD